ncbi:MAG: hypothetical protein JWN48_3361 [Myxococcaceae bacterium]|nr:hypothetical protein [Myxococcaceae bacterium]
MEPTDTTTTSANARPSAARVPASYILFAAVASVLTLGAARASEEQRARPDDDAQVVAQVPARSTGEGQALERLQARAASTPGQLASALALAQGYIEASRRAGDPRYLGAAEAALARWTVEPDPPASVRVLRATILQSRHQFDAALRDLDAVLARAPDDAQALLTRATILTVQADYARARRDCRQLAPLVAPSYGVACSAALDALTGRGQAARAALETVLHGARAPEERSWLHSLLGEQAFWLGDASASEAHLRAALALDPGDRYSRALYADLLLDAGRYPEVLRLLRESDADDALLLRSALAELALGHTRAPVIEAVAQNFLASRLRGDAVHRREEARFCLARGDLACALPSALESWSVQREPWDARLVLEAAVRSKQPERAAPVVAWLEQTQFEAPRLQALRAAAGGLR